MDLTPAQRNQVRAIGVRHRSFPKVFLYGSMAIVAIPGPPMSRQPISTVYVIEPNGGTRQPRQVMW